MASFRTCIEITIQSKSSELCESSFGHESDLGNPLRTRWFELRVHHLPHSYQGKKIHRSYHKQIFKYCHLSRGRQKPQEIEELRKKWRCVRVTDSSYAHWRLGAKFVLCRKRHRIFCRNFSPVQGLDLEMTLTFFLC